MGHDYVETKDNPIWNDEELKKNFRDCMKPSDGEIPFRDFMRYYHTVQPGNINREAWTAEWVKHDGYTECSKCEHWYDSPDYEDDGDRPAFCPSCGRAMTPEAWAILEQRLRG